MLPSEKTMFSLWVGETKSQKVEGGSEISHHNNNYCDSVNIWECLEQGIERAIFDARIKLYQRTLFML